MTTLNFMKQTKRYACTALLLSSLSTFAQEPLATTNTEIEGVTLDHFFHQETDTSTDTSKTTFAVNILDDDPTSDWAGNLEVLNTFNAANNLPLVDEPILVFNLNGAVDLAEIQYLTVTRQYLFQVLVSTTVTDDYTQAEFVDITPVRDDNVTKNGESFLASNDDATYKSFDLGSNPGVTFVKLYKAGRTNSEWNTISELKFYSAEAIASTRDEELSNASIYPNPANNVLFLDNINDKVSKVEVVSIGGQVLLSKEVDAANVTLNTSALANGVYFVNFTNTTSNVNSSKTIVVQH